MPQDDALNFSDHLGRMAARLIVDQGASVQDVIRSSDGSLVIHAPTATAHAVAIAPEVKVTDSVETVIRDNGRSIQIGLVSDHAKQVELAAAFAAIYEALRLEGVPPMDALLILLTVAGYCLIRFADD